MLKKGFATRFNRRWFVLDQQYLTYYETFDQERDEPIDLRVSCRTPQCGATELLLCNAVTLVCVVATGCECRECCS